MVRTLYSSALDMLFPPQCVSCGTPGAWVCATHAPTMQRIGPPFCTICAQPLGPRDGDRLCRRCAAVHRLKYDGWRVLARVLAQPLAEAFHEFGVQPDVLVPVPLHPKREKDRGYNQAALLADELGRVISVPVNTHVLQRIKATPPQARAQDMQARQTAVIGAFRCGERLNSQNILLLDDVCATGATPEDCAIALWKAGVSTVWGLTVTREA
ncbi:MAG: ComF family protein [Dehalococcoidia bacterium]|nr:ComF family protein [Dehalococcoidia bacterium]